MIARLKRLVGALATAVPALWAGMILGAGFIAVPAIFAVPPAAKPVAYSAAARVFERLAMAEWIFAGLLALCFAVLSFPPRRKVAAATLLALLVTQAIWLRPELIERANLLAAGATVAPSSAHAIYAALELCKLAWLAGLAYAASMDKRDPVQGIQS